MPEIPSVGALKTTPTRDEGSRIFFFWFARTDPHHSNLGFGSRVVSIINPMNVWNDGDQGTKHPTFDSIEVHS